MHLYIYTASSLSGCDSSAPSPMTKASQRERQKAQAEKARLGRAAKKASASSNPPSNDLRPSSTSSLPDGPADSQPVRPKAQLSTSRRNPPCARSASAALTSDSGSSAAVKCPSATQAHPPRTTAIAAQALLQQVQLSSGHDSEEGSELGDEKSGELTDDQTSGSVSDTETDHISPEFTGQLEVSAPSKKSPFLPRLPTDPRNGPKHSLSIKQTVRLRKTKTKTKTKTKVSHCRHIYDLCLR